MSEYIEREDVIEAINARRDLCVRSKKLYAMGLLNQLLDVVSDTDCFPAADVQPVVHGEWVNRRGNNGLRHLWRCSICNFRIDNAALVKRSEMPNFCPNCGAMMDRKEGPTDDTI